MVAREKLLKIAVIIANLIYVFLLAAHLIAVISYGTSWFLTTILFYSAFAYVILLAFSYYIKKRKQPTHNKLTTKHVKYYVIIFFTFILLLDLGLRLIPKYKSYTERNYGWFYKSDYSRHRDIENKECLYHENSKYTYKNQDFEFQHSYNEFGLRERANIIELTKDKTVVLTIGDSFTEGVGTMQDSTWQRFLEFKLNQDTSEYIVINAGISGSDPVHAINLLDYLLHYLDPNYVILSIGNSDFIDIAQRGGFDSYKKQNKYIREQPIHIYIYSWSYIYRAVIHAVYSHPEVFMSDIEYNNKMNESSEIIYQAVEKLVAISDEKHFEPIVLFYPVEYETEKLSYNYEGTDDLISKIKTTKQIEVINIMDYYRQNNDSLKLLNHQLFWPIDGHNTQAGYKIWSVFLFSNFWSKIVVTDSIIE